MFILTAKAPRLRSLLLCTAVLLTALAAILALRSRGTEQAEAPLRAETNEQRVAYLTSLGWTVDPEPIETLRLTLPDELIEPYRSYNALQLRQGFDLTPLLGETLERCTYRVRNYPDRPRGCQADLYICDGAVVAGDVVCTGADGFIGTLEFPAAK